MNHYVQNHKSYKKSTQSEKRTFTVRFVY